MTSDLPWIFLTALAVAALLPNVLSLLQGVRLGSSVHRAMRLALGAFLPPAVILLPVRGLEPGFDDNVRAILSQSYREYRLVVVADTSDDPAVSRIRDIARGLPQVRIAFVLSDPGPLQGKVNALRSALAHLEAEDEVVAFADSDIRPGKDWLRQLVQPLADSTVGVATGFRWYVPSRPTFWSLVRSEWNAVSANVLFDPRRAFAWGGSCAVRRDHLGALHLEDRWRGVLSDDLVLTEAVRASGLKIAYAPAALVPTHEDSTRATALEWCLRQIMMATLYLPIVRSYAAAAFAAFIGSILLGIASVGIAFVAGPGFLLPAFLFLVPLPSAIAKSAIRRRALFSASPTLRDAWKVPMWRASLASLAVPWVMAWGLLRTRRPTTVRWRGRVYDVRDPRAVRLLESEDEGRRAEDRAGPVRP